MDVYYLMIRLHVAGAVILEISAIGLLASVVILTHGTSADSPSQAARAAGLFDKGVPAGAALVLVTGLYMVVERWGLREPWLIASLAALVGVAPLTALLVSPEIKRLQVRRASSIPPGRQARRGDGSLLIATVVVTAVSLAELVVMVAKPSGITAVMILAVAAIAGALSPVAYLRLGGSR